MRGEQLSAMPILVARFGGVHVLLAVVLLMASVVACGLATLRVEPRLARLSGGLAALTVLVATALPQSWPPIVERGDLEPAPMGDTLGRLPEIVAAPGSLAATLLVLNAAIYVPVGWSTVLVLGRRRRALVAGTVLSILVEMIQFLVLGRVAATDDVIINAVGCFVGAVVALPIERTTALRRRKLHETQGVVLETE